MRPTDKHALRSSRIRWALASGLGPRDNEFESRPPDHYAQDVHSCPFGWVGATAFDHSGSLGLPFETLNVSDLGDVLELMHSSSQRWSTLRLAGHEWRNREAFSRAWEHHFDEVRKTGTATLHSVALRRVDGVEPPDESREDWRVWLAKPDDRRAEFQVGDEVVTAVFHGGSWWSWSPSRGFITNKGAPNASHGFGPGEPLIDPAIHLASLQLQMTDRTTFLTRPAYVVTALPQQVSQHGFDATFHMLGTGADLYRLVVDAAVGVLLRVQAEFQGEAFRVIEVDDIAINERFGDATFDSNRLRNGLNSL